MTRRWWGGPGLSLVIHAALLISLIHFAGLRARVDATNATSPARIRFVSLVTSATGAGSGGGAPAAALPRPARMRASRPLDVAPPRAFTSVEPLPVAAVPVIATEAVDMTLGAPLAVNGDSRGRGTGPGAGGGDGPGLGPGGGPGDVYEPGVGGVSNPALIHEVRPNFTVDAMRARIEGLVVLEVVVRADGTVDPAAIRITRSLGYGLDREATIAVTQWRFRPSLRLGQPVASRVVVELAFEVR